MRCIQMLTAQLLCCSLLVSNVSAAIVVAAADSLPEEKAKADIVCDGVDDQVELAASLAKARQGDTPIDVNPKTQKSVRCALNHAVEWLPGNYRLSATLEIPDAANCVIRAEGTTLHQNAQRLLKPLKVIIPWSEQPGDHTNLHESLDSQASTGPYRDPSGSQHTR